MNQRTPTNHANGHGRVRTHIDNVSPHGETLTPSQLRMVSGGAGETCTGDNNSCDVDGDPPPSGGGGSGGRFMLMLML